MNIFKRLVGAHYDPTRTLGNPLPTDGQRRARMAHFAAMTGGRGFRQPKAEPRVDLAGRTRGERKRLARQRAFGV